MQGKLAVFVVVTALTVTANCYGQGYPQVQLVFGYLPFDRNCEEWVKQPIDQRWYPELRTHLKSFQDYWNNEAPRLLGTTVAELKVPFERKEMTAFLTLCPVQSMSRPLIINARFFLPALMKEQARPMYLFSALVFHELLHTYLSPLVEGRSVLLMKYKDETPVLRNHLHLFAVMKLVYLKLGRADQLRDIIATDSSSKDPSYRKAWEIVNDVEGYESFMKELTQ